jgi:hypothetical protein
MSKLYPTVDNPILILRCTLSPIGGVLGKEGHSALFEIETYLRCEAIYYRLLERYRNARDQCRIKVVSQVCPVSETERGLEGTVEERATHVPRWITDQRVGLTNLTIQLRRDVSRRS